MEHYWKSLVHDGDTVSVHRPGFFARRFQNFMKDKVFKKQEVVRPKPLAGAENVPGVSFVNSGGQRNISVSGAGPAPSSHRKSQYRRALSSVTNTSITAAACEPTNPSERTENEILSPPVRGGTSKVRRLPMSFVLDNIILFQLLIRLS